MGLLLPRVRATEAPGGRPGVGKKLLTLMIIPHNEDRVREFSLSRPVLWGVCAALVVSFCALGFYAVGYFLSLGREVELAALETENAELGRHLQVLKGKLGGLRARLDVLVESDRQMRALVDFSEPGEDVRQAGVGGLSQEASPWEGYVPYQTGESLQQAYVSLDQLIREAKFLEESFGAITDSLRTSQVLRDHTPSVSPVPMDAECWISSDFGPRIDPFTGRKQFHNGLDLAGRPGTPILATADGVVSKVAKDRILGWYIKLEHGQGYQTLYGHMRARPPLERGARVRRGQAIGEMGKTGRATATHVHYMVIRRKLALNPASFLLDRGSTAAAY